MIAVAQKLLVFYTLLGVGFAVRRTTFPRRKLGAFLITYLLPFLFFTAALGLHDRSLFQVSIFAMLSTVGVFAIAYHCTRTLFGHERAIAVGAMSAWGNNAFLGMPLAFAMFGDRGLEVASVWAVGSITLFAVLGSTLLASNEETRPKSLRNWMFKFLWPPFIPAFLVGYVLSATGLAEYLPMTLIEVLKAASFLLSTAYVGMCLSFEKIHGHKSFCLSVLGFKLIGLPLLVSTICLIDASFLNLFNRADYPNFVLMAAMPVAVNVVVLFQDSEEYIAVAAFCVTVSTLLSGILAVVIGSL